MICVIVVIMVELTQRQQERIAKSSSDRLRSQLVRGGADEGEVVQMDRDELKAAAAQIEVEKRGARMPVKNPFPMTRRSCFGRLWRLHPDPMNTRC